MSELQPVKKKKKLVNNRRKSRELVMKSIYRGIINQFDSLILIKLKKTLKMILIIQKRMKFFITIFLTGCFKISLN